MHLLLQILLGNAQQLLLHQRRHLAAIGRAVEPILIQQLFHQFGALGQLACNPGTGQVEQHQVLQCLGMLFHHHQVGTASQHRTGEGQCSGEGQIRVAGGGGNGDQLGQKLVQALATFGLGGAYPTTLDQFLQRLPGSTRLGKTPSRQYVLAQV